MPHTLLADRYELGGEIGRGGMASVHRARDSKHDRDVAIKLLLPEIAGALGADRFLREIAIAAKLNHPHIIPLLDSGEVHGVPFYVMPIVEGETLRALLDREQQLQLEVATRIATEIADALDYAHAHGVVHRDIKPENVILSGRHAFVADFGIAKAVSAAAQATHVTHSGIAVGTPAYMSPEQAAGGDQIDGRSDIYSLGCVMYEMLGGQPPFTGINAQAIVARRFVETPSSIRVLRETVPMWLDAIVMRMLARSPADRFATAADVADALRAAQFDGTRAFAGVAATGLTPVATARVTPSIAVLPFSNLSSDPENEYFSDGVTEEILSALSQIPLLHVAARTSSFAFKGKHEDVRVIAERLNVRAVLEGTVRRSGRQLRITAQLVNAADGFRLWSGRFDRTLDDIFAIQDEIASAIADALRTALLGDAGATTTMGAAEAPARPTTSVEAYEAYLRGRYFWKKRTEDGLRRALEAFERALEIDPHYAPAYAGLADASVTLAIYGMAAPAEAMTLAREMAERALALAPALSEAHATLGVVHAAYDWKWDRAAAAFQHAIEHEPRSPAARQWYALHYLLPLGRFDDALREVERALQLDPLGLAVRASVGTVLIYQRRYDEAIAALHGTLEMDSAFTVARYFLGLAYLYSGDTQRGIAELSAVVDASGESPEMLSALAQALALGGAAPSARALLARLDEMALARYVSPCLIAQVHIALGEHDQALAALESAVEQRATDLLWLAVRPSYDAVRDEPRFGRLLDRMGLSRTAPGGGERA